MVDIIRNGPRNQIFVLLLVFHSTSIISKELVSIFLTQVTTKPQLKIPNDTVSLTIEQPVDASPIQEVTTQNNPKATHLPTKPLPDHHQTNNKMYNLSHLTTSTHDLLHHPNLMHYTPLPTIYESGVSVSCVTYASEPNSNNKKKSNTNTNNTTIVQNQPYIPYTSQPLFSRFFLKDQGRAVRLAKKDDSWRWCPLCRGTKLCVVIGRCLHSGKRVKVVF
jgi:hypothetical protein